jgi:hypothetical protein
MVPKTKAYKKTESFRHSVFLRRMISEKKGNTLSRTLTFIDLCHIENQPFKS